MGKRNLENAIESCPQYDVSVRWRPYLLRPNYPREGVEKAPNTPENPRVGQRMKIAGQNVGIDFTGKCDRSPNTIYCHCLLAHLDEEYGLEVQNAVQERLFKLYFTDGIYPSIDNMCELLESMKRSGDGCCSAVDVIKARGVMESGEKEPQVVGEAQKNSQIARGVPFFFMNGKAAFSGAQPPEAFKEAFELC